MKKMTKAIAMLVLASVLMLMLSSCGSAQDTTAAPTDPIMIDTVPQAAPDSESSPAAESSLPETAPAVESGSYTPRQDGERFEDVIILEGIEETVKYEHVKNETLGIELDYDYENFERRSSSSGECFVSRYDNADSPENYLELSYSDEDADAAADSIAASLSQNYEVVKGTRMLNKAGACTSLDASSPKDNQTPDQMQAGYIIPLGKGCIIATMHYGFEAAEGFGSRFSAIMNTLEIIQ